MQFMAKLGSNSDLTQVQSWTTLVQRAFNNDDDTVLFNFYAWSEGLEV